MVKIKVKKRIIIFFLMRLAILALIIIFASKLPAFGFMGNTPLYDDFRYEEGAVLYAESAKTPIDTEAFTNAYASMNDWVGFHLSDPFSGNYLWYWIVCLLVYFTHTRWSIRILNIVLMLATISVVKRILIIVDGKKSSEIADKIMSYFPYFIIFPCFSYKECLISFSTFSIWEYFVKKRYGIKNEKEDCFRFFISILCMVFARSGLSIILLSMAIFYCYFEEIKERITINRILMLLIGLIIIFVLLYRFRAIIIYKFMAYIGTGGDNAVGRGNLLKVNGIFEIWKIPMAYVFSVINPIGYTGEISSWSNIVSILNITMCPIAISSFIYIIIGEKKDKMLFWMLLLYYLISVSTSILIFRQLFSVLPIPIMFSAMYFGKAGKNAKICVLLLGVMLAFIMFVI